MAKKKINKNTVKKSELSDLLKRKELVIGAISIAVIAAIVGVVTLKSINNLPKHPRQETSSTFITPNPFATTKPTLGKEISEVKNLSNTSSDIYEIVRNGDSYWRIAKRVCGNGKIYMLLSEYNNSKPLFKDDLVKVSCF